MGVITGSDPEQHVGRVWRWDSVICQVAVLVEIGGGDLDTITCFTPCCNNNSSLFLSAKKYLVFIHPLP